MTISTAKGSTLQILSLERVDSTQTYLVNALKSGELEAPVAVTAQIQEEGKGSRGGRWEGLEGNFFLSFAVPRAQLPDDLKLESSSIYFAYILKELLSENGSRIWLKWPNDYYIDEKKIGGVITNLVNDNLVCGIGLNLKAAPQGFGILDIIIKRNLLIEIYIKKLKKLISWKQIFSKYELEFDKSRSFQTHSSEQMISLRDARLLDDGSIECNGKKVFGVR